MVRRYRFGAGVLNEANANQFDFRGNSPLFHEPFGVMPELLAICARRPSCSGVKRVSIRLRVPGNAPSGNCLERRPIIASNAGRFGVHKNTLPCRLDHLDFSAFS
jgi:hypothetical protein